MRRVMLRFLAVSLGLSAIGCDSVEVGVHTPPGIDPYVKGKLRPGESQPPPDKPIGTPYYPGGPPPSPPTIPATPP
jgi:hypothetical protein